MYLKCFKFAGGGTRSGSGSWRSVKLSLLLIFPGKELLKRRMFYTSPGHLLGDPREARQFRKIVRIMVDIKSVFDSLITIDDQYDWTTGGARQWKWKEEVPCRTSRPPLASLCLLLFLKVWKQRGFETSRATWDHCRCMVEPASGHIRCRLKVGTPQTGRLLNGATKLRGTGMSLVGLSRHPPPSQCLILPSGQTLIHSSRHLSCPNQEPV